MMLAKIERLLKCLQMEYILIWMVLVVLVVLYETGVLVEGTFAGDVQVDYMLQTIGVLLAIIFIPLSLRLFRLSLVKYVQFLSTPDALRSYRRWSEIRLGLLFVPALVNLSIYYMTLNNTGVLCAGMCMVASLFCVPTRKRMVDELDLSKEE